MPINYDAQIEVRDNRNGSWYWIHTHILRDRTLTKSEKIVYSTIASYSNSQQECFPSIKTISLDSGVAKRHVYRCLTALRKRKLLEVVHKRGRSNVYILCKTTPNSGGGDIMSPVTNRHGGGDMMSGGGDKEALLTRSNITRLNKLDRDPQEIFDYYVKRTSSKEKLSPKRKQSIRSRIKDFGVDGCKQAIDGMMRDRFYRGENDRGWKADLDYIFRNFEITEKLIIKSGKHGTSKKHPTDPLAILSEKNAVERGLVKD